MICRTAYLSSAARGVSEADVAQILRVSRRNNLAFGLTGMLMYHDGNFFQVLEGPADNVETCYAQLATDPRHHSLIRLITREEEGRAFGNWCMGHAAPEKLNNGHRSLVVSLRDLARNSGDTQNGSTDNATNREIAILTRNFLAGFKEFSFA